MKLSNEQIAQCACIVTGDIRAVPVWAPSFENEVLRRDQALAIVEWLIARIWELYGSINSYNKDWLLDKLATVGHGVKDKDIPALMAMVLELSQEGR